MPEKRREVDGTGRCVMHPRAVVGTEAPRATGAHYPKSGRIAI